MTWIVFTILFAIAFWVGVGCWLYGRKQEEAYKEAGRTDEISVYRFAGLITMVTVAVLWVFMTGWMTVKTVGEREVGIVYNFTGTIAGKRDKGWVTIAPWQHMEKENIAIQHAEFVFGQDNSAVSKDQQDIFARLAVNYSIDAPNVLDLYRRVGPAWKATIIESRVPQVFKEVTSTFPTPRITEERVALREQTRERLIQELEPYDIDVVDVFITNLGFSELYSQAIEAEAEAGAGRSAGRGQGQAGRGRGTPACRRGRRERRSRTSLVLAVTLPPTACVSARSPRA